MIKPGEIQNIAREVAVRDQQIEKDYILSWTLQGIAHRLLFHFNQRRLRLSQYDTRPKKHTSNQQRTCKSCAIHEQSPRQR